MITSIEDANSKEEVYAEEAPSSARHTSILSVMMSEEDSPLSLSLYLKLQQQSIEMEKRDTSFSVGELDFSIQVTERYSSF